MDQPDIGYLVNRAARHLRASFGRALAGTGLRPQQAAVLVAIARHPDAAMTPTAIGDAIDADAATTSGLIDRLVRDGWLVSSPNPADGRSRLLTLTGKAHDALPAVLSVARRVSADATATLSPAELETLASLLRRVGEPAAPAGDAGEDGDR